MSMTKAIPNVSFLRFALVLVLTSATALALTTTGDTTNGSTTIGNINTTGIVVGMSVSGAGIPAGSVVVSIAPGNPGTITLSASATATGAGIPLTFTSPGQADAYYLGYFGNANMTGFPDSQMNIVNPGSTGGYNGTTDGQKTPVGNLCANIYVFKADQEMVECCSCLITPNGHIQLSTNVNLTANPLQNPATVPIPVAGVIKIVSSNTAGGCAVGNIAVAGTQYAPNGSLRTWNTHARQTVGGASPLYTVTETPFRPGTLEATELSKIQAQCYFLDVAGSGRGRCTCGGVPQ